MSNEIATVSAERALTKLEGFQSVEEMKKWATTIIDSGLLPNSITEPEQVITIVQHGKELGLSPHVAINNINVISGRPTLSSTIIGALLKRKGIEWVWDEDFAMIKDEENKVKVAPDGAPDRRTTIHFFWKSDVTDRVMETTFSVTWAQYVIAGLTDKSNWKKLPKHMLRARCLSEACRALWPDVLSGFYTDLEIADSTNQDIDVVLNEDGEVILKTNN
jgi:hypothetical protein